MAKRLDFARLSAVAQCRPESSPSRHPSSPGHNNNYQIYHQKWLEMMDQSVATPSHVRNALLTENGPLTPPNTATARPPPLGAGAGDARISISTLRRVSSGRGDLSSQEPCDQPENAPHVYMSESSDSEQTIVLPAKKRKEQQMTADFRSNTENGDGGRANGAMFTLAGVEDPFGPDNVVSFSRPVGQPFSPRDASDTHLQLAGPKRPASMIADGLAERQQGGNKQVAGPSANAIQPATSKKAKKGGCIYMPSPTSQHPHTARPGDLQGFLPSQMVNGSSPLPANNKFASRPGQDSGSPNKRREQAPDQKNSFPNKHHVRNPEQNLRSPADLEDSEEHSAVTDKAREAIQRRAKQGTLFATMLARSNAYTTMLKEADVDTSHHLKPPKSPFRTTNDPFMGAPDPYIRPGGGVDYMNTAKKCSPIKDIYVPPALPATTYTGFRFGDLMPSASSEAMNAGLRERNPHLRWVNRGRERYLVDTTPYRWLGTVKDTDSSRWGTDDSAESGEAGGEPGDRHDFDGDVAEVVGGVDDGEGEGQSGGDGHDGVTVEA